jgi:hypothetical protein
MRCQPTGIANIFVSNEDIDVLSHLCLLGHHAVADARVSCPKQG